jgi:hypothetical protein
LSANYTNHMDMHETRDLIIVGAVPVGGYFATDAEVASWPDLAAGLVKLPEDPDFEGCPRSELSSSSRI